MKARARFYRDVSIAQPGGPAAGYAVLLDGKPIRTPAGAEFQVPSSALAEGIAEEWRDQNEKLRPESMGLTRLANTALDRVRGNRDAVVDQILAFGKSDLLCYRASAPADLVRRQQESWDPLLEWAVARHRAHLRISQGFAFIEQPGEALAALRRAIEAHDDFGLAAVHSAATIAGSAVIALAVSDGRLDEAAAFAASELEEAYQAEKWGRDSQAQIRATAMAKDLATATRFLKLLRA